MPLSTVFLGLGSNRQRQQHLHAALDALAELLVDMRCSPVFESEAVGIQGAPFYNLAVMGKTTLPLEALSRQLKAIEAANGRYDEPRNGLPLDIDVLFYNQLIGDFSGLQLPRAEVLHNAFVLWPLALLAPETCHPETGQTLAEHWEHARIQQQLWPVAFEWRGIALTPETLLAQSPPR